jgi:hypothetical protein
LKGEKPCCPAAAASTTRKLVLRGGFQVGAVMEYISNDGVRRAKALIVKTILEE